MDVEARDPVYKVMSDRIVAVEEKFTLRALAEVLRDADVGVVLVRMPDGSAGVVSERDVVRAIADGADLDEVWAADVMHTPLVVVERDERIIDAGIRMFDEGVRHLAVIDRGQVVGVVAALDVLPVLTEDLLERS